MTSRILFRAGLLTAGLMLLTSGVSAQDDAKQKAEKENVETRIRQERVVIEATTAAQGGEFNIRAPYPGPARLNDTVVFLSSEFNFDGKTVKNAPYSGDAVTETVQVLSDGNRIVRRTSSTVYRDSEGRIRSEQTLTGIGPFSVAGEPVQTISISDPVAGFSYVLDTRSKVARKMPGPRIFYRNFTPGAEGRGGTAQSRGGTVQGRAAITQARELQIVELSAARAAGGGNAPAVAGTRVITNGPVTYGRENAPKSESLGTQVVEGVTAEGTRTTVTIPAGQIGNERPIEIVSERWYSPELQVVVMSKRNDPMTGDMTYRLTNINRNEPVRSLFEVPGDFKIQENSLPARMNILRPAEKP